MAQGARARHAHHAVPADRCQGYRRESIRGTEGGGHGCVHRCWGRFSRGHGQNSFTLEAPLQVAPDLVCQILPLQGAFPSAGVLSGISGWAMGHQRRQITALLPLVWLL